MVITKERLDAVLEKIRPCLEEDEDDIELVNTLLRVTAPAPGAAAAAVPSSGAISLDDRLRELEANLIGWALKASGGNKSRAAALLQIKRSTLGDRIRRCGLQNSALFASRTSDPTVAQT
jgi:DNA-binding NtrC family response regulator